MTLPRHSAGPLRERGAHPWPPTAFEFTILAVAGIMFACLIAGEPLLGAILLIVLLAAGLYEQVVAPER